MHIACMCGVNTVSSQDYKDIQGQGQKAGEEINDWHLTVTSVIIGALQILHVTYRYTDTWEDEVSVE